MRLKNVISNIQPEHIQIGDCRALMVGHFRAINKIQHYNFDAIIVDSEIALKYVLAHDELYLFPLFYKGNTHHQCDGIYDAHAPHILTQKIQILQDAIDEYKDLPLPSNQNKRLLAKVLRYLLSRKISLNPLNTRLSDIGYNYPLISDMSIENDPIHIIKNLNDFATQNYFAKKTIDKVNICYDCHSSYLNFSECCTKCNSLDLKTEELVHHFRCAYVGPQSDFTKDDKMICPKCNHQLKHIGIDYDKPSEIHTCGSCNHSSQETKMKAKCVDCSKENELDQLVTYEICKYGPTEKAKTFASQENNKPEFVSDQSSKDTILINYGAYNLIKSHESKRTHIPSLSTFDMVISLDPSITANLNQGMQKSLIEELASIIKPYLKPNDLLAQDTEQNIHALLIDYDFQQFENIKETLDYNLNKMLIDNGWSKVAVVTIHGKIID